MLNSMKRIIIILILLAGCGQEQAQPYEIPPYGYNSILWEGLVSDNAEIETLLSEVKSCMAHFGYSRAGEPGIVIVDKDFFCGFSLARGCLYNNSIIYLSPEPATDVSIYIEDIPLTRLTVLHEMVHWVTSKGNADHGTKYMSTCVI